MAAPAPRKVKDTQLYDVLGVAPEATDIEQVAISAGRTHIDNRLKKAYRKMAIKVSCLYNVCFV